MNIYNTNLKNMSLLSKKYYYYTVIPYKNIKYITICYLNNEFNYYMN